MMQQYKNEELIAATMGESAQELAAQIDPESTHVVIGKLPTRGQVITINGLKFVVLSKSDKKGTLHLRIMQPKVVNDGN